MMMNMYREFKMDRKHPPTFYLGRGEDSCWPIILKRRELVMRVWHWNYDFALKREIINGKKFKTII